MIDHVCTVPPIADSEDGWADESAGYVCIIDRNVDRGLVTAPSERAETRG